MDKHVLVPVDGSDSSWEAFEYALEEHHDDTLTVLHVVDPMEGDYEPDGETDSTVKRSEMVESEVTDRLDTADRAELRVEFVTREGRPTEEIVAHADTEGVDQVVMGSRGLSGVKRLLLGSVAEAVVRRADVPVNIVR
jgi:nucleotide-binding universal stress UspA family protein